MISFEKKYCLYSIVAFVHSYLAHHVHVGHVCTVVAGAAGTAADALDDVRSLYLAKAFLFIPDSRRPHCTNPLTQQHAIETRPLKYHSSNISRVGLPQKIYQDQCDGSNDSNADLAKSQYDFFRLLH